MLAVKKKQKKVKQKKKSVSLVGNDRVVMLCEDIPSEECFSMYSELLHFLS